MVRITLLMLFGIVSVICFTLGAMAGSVIVYFMTSFSSFKRKIDFLRWIFENKEYFKKVWKEKKRENG